MSLIRNISQISLFRRYEKVGHKSISNWHLASPSGKKPKLEGIQAHKYMFLQVRVTTNYFPKFSSEELLATVGSCLGLWLGLGVVHILDILVTTVGQFFSRQLGWN